MTMTERLLASIATHLQQQSAGSEVGSEELEVAAQLVGEALGSGGTTTTPPPAHSLLEIFIAGEAALSVRAEAEPAATSTTIAAAPTAPPAASAPADAASSSSNGLLERFIGNLQQRGFFAGTVEGSPEYLQLHETARGQFVARFGHRLDRDAASAQPLDAAAAAAPPPPAEAADAPPVASSGEAAPAAAVETPPTSLPELIAYAQARLDADDFTGAAGAASSAMELDVGTEQLVQVRPSPSS